MWSHTEHTTYSITTCRSHIVASSKKGNEDLLALYLAEGIFTHKYGLDRNYLEERKKQFPQSSFRDAKGSRTSRNC